MKISAFSFLLILALLFFADIAQAATGCDLNDPDRDVKRLFPESTGYKAYYYSISKKGGDALLKKIEERLGDKFKGIYETADVPNTVYEIRVKDKITGYIHGVNQKGKYGGIQVFLAFDTGGTIRSFYIQKLTGKDAALFRAPAFDRQFEGLSLKDFYRYSVARRLFIMPPKMSGPAIKDPTGSPDDYFAILRAVKKNLILMDEYIFNNGFLKYFEKLEN